MRSFFERERTVSDNIQKHDGIQHTLRLVRAKTLRLEGLMVTFLSLSLFSACTQVNHVMDLTGINGRNILEYQRKDQTVVKCVSPPSDLIATYKTGGIKPDVSLRKLGLFINSAETVEPKAIKEFSADFPDIEVLRFRVCEQYGNSLLTLDQYQQFQKVLQVVQDPVPSQGGPIKSPS